MKRQANSPYTWMGLIFAIVAVSMALTVTTAYADKSDGAKRMPLTNQYYYLTIETYQGDLATVFLPDCDAGVDCACADGYHMASFGELFLGTGLVYNTERGLSAHDAG